MMKRLVADCLDYCALIKYSWLVQLNRKHFLVVLAVLLWPLFHITSSVLGLRVEDFNAVQAQNFLIGLPLYLLACGTGVRVIAREIEQRTLEVSYTIAGGPRGIWLAKILSMAVILLLAEGLLAIVTSIYLTGFPLLILINVFQGSLFFMVLAMWVGALVKNELSAILIILGMSYVVVSNTSSRWSPLFNHLAVVDVAGSDLVRWVVQNHIVSALLILILMMLSFSRADNREKLLKD